MTHNEKVASYKAYLQTGDPQFIPAVYEKTAHANEVQAWKDRWSKTAGCGDSHSKKKKKKKGASYNKEARAGHPANVALARALSPGILPGMNSGGSKVHVSHNGDFNHDIAGFIEGGVDPGTLSYLRGDKTAAPKQERVLQGYFPPQSTPTNAPPVPLPAPPQTPPQDRTLPLPTTTPPPPTPPPPGASGKRKDDRRKKTGEKTAAGSAASLSDLLRKFVAKQK